MRDHCGSLPRLPRHLPDRGLPRALSARCAALHLLSHHRAQGPDRRANSARPSATASMAATIAWRSALEQVRAGRRRSEARRPRRSRRAGACASLRRSTMPAFGTLFAGSPVKRTGRDRFVRNVLIAIGNSGDAAARRRRRAAARRRVAAGPRRWPSGRCRGCARASACRQLARHIRWPTRTDAGGARRMAERRLDSRSSASGSAIRGRAWRSALAPARLRRSPARTARRRWRRRTSRRSIALPIRRHRGRCAGRGA